MGYDTVDQAAAADQQRTLRAFIGLAASALGYDTTYATDDMNPSSPTGQYIIANPNGSYSSLGQPVSNQQTLLGTGPGGALILSPIVLIAGAVIAYLVLSD